MISSIEWNGDLPYIYHYGGKVYRYLCNAHGDVVALVDEDGVEVNSYSYDVFGKLISEEETIPNAIRYRHEYYDAESGMYYLRGRYYDPTMRRFTTPDPAEDGINHYAYCGNNPFMNIDPSEDAYFEHVIQYGEDIVITKYYSGDDLDQLCDMELDDYFGKTSLLSILRRKVPWISIAQLPSKYIGNKVKKDIIQKAKQAKSEGRGLAVKIEISPDNGIDLPVASFVLAQVVEDYAAGKRKP